MLGAVLSFRPPSPPRSGPLHYINSLTDAPPNNCSFDAPWAGGPGHNVVGAVGDYSRKVRDGEGSDIPLRYLVHFLGDLHQPLHLSGRLRGGNGLHVRFEGRTTSLHALWDGVMIQKSIRELGNYTTPGPSRRIERALRGRIYDPFVRFLVTEGIRGFWRDESLTWASCPDYAVLSPPAPAAVPASRPLPKKPPVVDTLMGLIGVPLVVYANLLPQWVLDYTPGSAKTGSLGGRRDEAQETFPDEAERDPAVPGCAWTWAREAHPLNCAYVWPADGAPGAELATPAYWGKVKGDLVIEKQLAMAGIRLAAVLNSIFDPNYGSELHADD